MSGEVIDLTPRPGESPCILAPGFIDLHAHLREPGDEAAETVRSGARAAAAGGGALINARAKTEVLTAAARWQRLMIMRL